MEGKAREESRGKAPIPETLLLGQGGHYMFLLTHDVVLMNIEYHRNRGSCTYYVITDGGGSLQMITVLHKGGRAK